MFDLKPTKGYKYMNGKLFPTSKCCFWELADVYKLLAICFNTKKTKLAHIACVFLIHGGHSALADQISDFLVDLTSPWCQLWRGISQALHRGLPLDVFIDLRSPYLLSICVNTTIRPPSNGVVVTIWAGASACHLSLLDEVHISVLCIVYYFVWWRVEINVT